MTSAALAAAVALAGCETDGLQSGRAMKELSAEMRAELTQKNMPLESPLLVRLFKQEAELEVWKQDASGRYELLKTYPICRWSGELGPKVKEGDRQAPEGFYTITPAQMNPNSQFYLSFNMGFPNAYDKAWGRTGAHLMVHGDCSSRGCYAMTDDQIGEIYALARESFFGGQRAFQVQAYPFRMTPANFAKHRNNPNIPFWRMLKEGNDHFEVTHQEPVVEVCEKRYVFNPGAPQNYTPANNGIKLGTPWGGFRDQQTQPVSLKFNPAGKCPAYEVPSEVLAEVKAKQRQDDAQIASLSNRVSAAPIKTGRDGGMHPMFLAKLKPQEVREPDGTVRYMVDESAKKKLGTYVNPPIETYPTEPETVTTAANAPASRTAPKQNGGSVYMTAAAESKPAPAPAPASSQSGGMFSGLVASAGRWFGSDREDTKPVSPPAARAAAPAPAPKPRPQPAATAAAHPKMQPGAPVPEEQTAQAAPASTPARQSAASGASLMNGAAPTVPTGSFDQRWGPVR
ncbi:MAG: murein L,D-transpeptidase [Alphaproteobacteria bacterium]|nr:MAG: murein L,D-transpeptidase [Alphaproteobacteria bacterium]